MAEYQEVFKKYYTTKHNGRKLMWQHSWGQCSIRSHFAAGMKELTVSLFQTLVLLLFNNTDSLSFNDIVQATAIGNVIKDLTYC